MATIVNDRDVLIQATVPRYSIPTDRAILLGTSTSVFQVPTSGSASPTTATLTATLLNLTGTVTWATSPTTTLTGSGNTRTLAYADMVSTTVTITASFTYDGVTYEARQTVAKVLDGALGIHSALVYAYQRSASAPTLKPGDITFTFASGAITTPSSDALSNGWTKSIPSGTDKLYVTLCSASGTGATDTVLNAEWATPVEWTANGLNGATIYIYQRAATSSAPTLPSATTTYTFATGVLTGLDNGWSHTMPAAGGLAYLHVSTATAVSTSATDTIPNTEWAAVQQMAVDGTNAQLLFLSSTGQSITYNGPGVETPASQTLSFTANLQNVSGTATFVCTKYNAAGSSLGTVTMGGSGNTRTLTGAQFTTSAAYTTVVATLGSLSDTMTVIRLQDGVSALAGYLTNEAHTVGADSDGTNVSFTGASGTFKVFLGITDITTSCAFSVVGTPEVTQSIGASTGSYSATAVGTWAAGTRQTVVTYRATYLGSTIDKVFSITKSLAGVAAPLLTLSSTSQSITYNGPGVETPASQTITFTATLQGTSGTATFVCTKYNAAGSSLGTVTLGGSGNTRTLTGTQFTTSSAYAVITATLGSLSDTITVVRLQDGVSALAGYLTNEAHTVACSSAGASVDFTGAEGTFKVFLGTTDITTSCTFAVVGTPEVTQSINSGTGVYSATAVGTWAAGTRQTVVTYRATYNGSTIDKVFTITKSIAGIDAPLLFLSSTAQAITYNGEGTITPSSQTISFTANLQNASGTATFVCTKYDSGGGSLGTVTMGGSGNTRTLTGAQFTTSSSYAIITATLGSLSDTMTVVRLQDGSAALSGYLTNESHTVPASSAGVVSSYTGAGGTFKVFLGTTDITSSCSFATVGSPVVTQSINSSSGVFSTTASGSWADASNTTTVTYRATYGSSTIDKVFTLTKSLAGATGSTGSTGGTGTTGDSARRGYTDVTGNSLATTPTSSTTSGSSSFPSTGVWGETVAWTALPPAPIAAGHALFQIDGVYSPTTGNTVWGIPYLSSLKVGTLSAIAADMGTITAGTITGALIRTASSGRRIEIDYSTNTLKGYDSGGTAVISVGATFAGQISATGGETVYPTIQGIHTRSTVNVDYPPGVYGTADGHNGVWGNSTGGYGVRAASTNNYALYARSAAIESIFGENTSGTASGHGVRGQAKFNGSSSIASGVVAATNGYDFYADGAGTNYGPFTGAHDALMPLNSDISLGDIVCDHTCIIRGGLSNTLFKVEYSSSPMQKSAVGVLATIIGVLADTTMPAAFILERYYDEQDVAVSIISPIYDEVKDSYIRVAMNALGEGQINVCGEGGNIEAGDLITTSSIVGKGMKQPDDLVRNYTVARARESVTFIGDEIKMIACIYLCG